MNVALCKCGVDVTDHDDVDDHPFDPSGTRYPCGARINSYLCPRPANHDEENVPCGPLIGLKLW